MLFPLTGTEKWLLSHPVTLEAMNVFSVNLKSDVYDRMLEFREYMEDQLDKSFSLDEIVNVILRHVELRGFPE